MEDKEIIDLYWQRQEIALTHTQEKYGRYCHSIAYRILNDYADSEECVSDTLLRAWNSIPPHRPGVLRTFLGKITRNLSLDRLEHNTAAKRGAGQTVMALEELSECIPAENTVEDAIEGMALTRLLNRFLETLSAEARKIFLMRYWYLCPVKEIADQLNVTESKVKMSLKRTRDQLKATLEEEGVYL